MGAKVSTPRDRTVGFVLLALAVAVLFAPDFRVAGFPIKQQGTSFAWLCAAILLLTAHLAARPNAKLTRCGAAILFVMGLVGPFIIHSINSSLGA